MSFDRRGRRIVTSAKQLADGEQRLCQIKGCNCLSGFPKALSSAGLPLLPDSSLTLPCPLRLSVRPVRSSFLPFINGQSESGYAIDSPRADGRGSSEVIDTDRIEEAAMVSSLTLDVISTIVIPSIAILPSFRNPSRPYRQVPLASPHPLPLFGFQTSSPMSSDSFVTS